MKSGIWQFLYLDIVNIKTYLNIIEVFHMFDDL